MHARAHLHTHKRACFFSEMRFTFWKVHRFPWESVSFSVNADPELSLCQRKAKRSESASFMGERERETGREMSGRMKP